MIFHFNVLADIFSWGGRGLEICKKRSDIFILVAFFVRTFVVGEGEGREEGKNRNVRRTLIVYDP